MDQTFLVSLLLVIASGLINAITGFFTKRSTDKAVFLGLMIGLASIALLPHFVMEMWGAKLPPIAYALFALSMMFEGLNGYLLSKAYMFGDLSQVYPIMRGTGVIFTPIIGVMLLGESLSPWGWLGMAGIACGIFLLSGWQPAAASKTMDKQLTMRPVLFAVSVGLCITGYTVVDKIALDYMSPASLLEVGNIGFLLVFVPRLLKRGLVRQEFARNGKYILLAAVCSPSSYLLFLIAMNMAPVSHLAPVREIGTVFAALLGVWLLNERQGAKRIVSAAMIVLGIGLIGIGG